MTVLTIQRVYYGKIETLPNEREYRIKDNDFSPVGTLTDWIIWATDLVIPKKIRVIDEIVSEDYEVEL